MSLRDIDPLSDNQDVVHSEIRTRKQFIEKELGELTQLRDQLKKMMAKEENLEKEIEQLMSKKNDTDKKDKEETDKEEEEVMDTLAKPTGVDGGVNAVLFASLTLLGLLLAVFFVHFNQQELYRS